MNDVGFPIATCARCERDVLLARDLDESGELIARCIHCGATLRLDDARFVGAASLSDLGYSVEGLQHPHEERGCRDGGCGVRQPDG